MVVQSRIMGDIDPISQASFFSMLALHDKEQSVKTRIVSEGFVIFDGGNLT